MTLTQAKVLSLKMMRENFKIRWAVGAHYFIGQHVKYQHQDYVVIGVRTSRALFSRSTLHDLWALKPVPTQEDRRDSVEALKHVLR